jgi:cytochrome c-type biogenesis protein CcmH/NrfF
MVNPDVLAAISDYFVWWQIPLALLLIVVIIFYVIYRKKQM